MIKVKIENKEDIINAVVEIWKNCPHQWADEDILAKIERGKNEIIRLIAGREKKL